MTRETKSMSISRRSFLAGTAGVAASSLILPGMPAFAAGGRIVVGTWGGDYARLLTENIDQPILNPLGYEIVQDQAGDPERRAKMLAERRLPRGSVDTNALQDSSMYQVYAQGLVEELDFDKIPNASKLLPNMRLPYGIPQIFSGMVLLYNPDKMDAPSAYADLFDPKMGNRLGIIDIQYRHNIAVASLIAGGSVTAVEKGKALLMELRKAGVRIYPTNEAFAQALKTEEIDGGPMWKARSLQWQKAGINVLAAVPSEGMVPYVSGFVIPKNAPNKDGAYAYLNALLEPEAQIGFAENMGYAGTTDVEMPKELQERVSFTPEQIEAMNPLDFEFFAKNDLELKTWWDREFIG
ncbi:ABC transporter substrate-binding protein [Jiella avicenniae]|uniref:Extracellular solute-binding protein n=1 Tax=Jiella avicenniae TaxID=2907202 RepID=A0A9X1P1Q8_9HYPH|nr:extracellular solute-binding protein [Jiella avicenniae]MCE7029812.1 extracellular solute-binding protein [Jiella avicenniae]